MVINKTRRVAYLQRYINSHGVELPPDYIEFKENAIFEKECVFCQHTHQMAPVYKYNPIEQNREATGVYCCDACNGLILNMIESEYSDLWRETKKASRVVDFEEKDYGNRQYKLNLYNVNEQFDNTVESYIIHKNTSLKCYFCGEAAETNDPEIQVPMSRHLYIDGGRVKVCMKRCYEDIWQNESPAESIHKSSKCAYCGSIYTITREEYETRADTGTLGKHMCPECSFAGIEIEQKHLNTVLSDAVNNSEPFTRIIFKICTICDEGFSMDLTLLHSRLKKIHTSEQKKPRCLECYVFDITDTARQKLFKLGELYTLIFYIDESNKNWSYRISKILNTEEKVILRPDNTYRKSNLLDCIADAVEAANTHGIQTELDLE